MLTAIKTITRNENHANEKLLTDITELFRDKPVAREFLDLYGEHCALVDDLVDEPGNPNTVEKCARLAYIVNNHPYWIQYRQALFLVDRLIHNTYFDSVKWEHSTEEWKRRDAKCMSHTAINMILAVMLIEFGEDTVNKYSLQLREWAYNKHKDDVV